MKLRQVLEGIKLLSANVDMDTEITGISYDSRVTQPGDLFVAVKGFETDGHRYIGAAISNGAAAILCQIPPDGDIPFVQTPDTRFGLALTARNFFGNPASEMKIIGITGTNGKTTVAQLLAHTLTYALDVKVGLIGTNGNRIGNMPLPSQRTTPESYDLQKLFRQMADEGCRYAVMEVSSHALALERTAGIRFAVGAFTNLTQDHLDFHGTMEAYAETKAKLLEQCEVAVMNLDDDWIAGFREKANCPVFSYALDTPGTDLYATDIQLLPNRVEFTACHGIQRMIVRLGIPGRFSVYNALTVLGCTLSLGIPLPVAAEALALAPGVQGRMEPVHTDGDYTILIDYAHTPDALENVLRTLRESAPGRVVAVFGCGGDRDRGKRPQMGRIATTLADFSIVTSDNPRTENPEEIIADILTGINSGAYTVIPDRREAIAYAMETHRSGDTILLAGKGHETYQEIGHTKYPMDERQIVAEILERRKQ